MEIYVNQVFGYLKEATQNKNLPNKDQVEKKIFNPIRIIAVTEGEVAVIDLENELVVPSWLRISDIEYMISDTEMCIIEDPIVLPANDNGASKAAIKTRDLIAPIINKYWQNNKDDLLDKNKRNKLFVKIAEENGLSYNMVRRKFCRFWQRGMVDNALLTDYKNCGAPGIDKIENQSSKKFGAKRKPRLGQIQNQGVSVRPKDRKYISKAINKHYNTKECKTLKEVYYMMWDESYIVNKYNEENELIGHERLPISMIPSQSQFQYWYHKDRDFKREKIGREGYSNYNKKYKELTGTVMSGVIGPGSQYQIDSTIADVYLQLEHGDIPYGRPVIFGITDTYSGMIVAIHVGVNPASWTEASSCLLNMIENKVEYCKREFNIEIQEYMWPSHHLPVSIITDRGEFVSEKSREFTKFTGVQVKHTPPFTPQMKSIVEQKFNLYNGTAQRFLPGAVRKGYGERGERRPELDATMTLQEFKKIIVALVLHHNNSSIRRKVGAKEERIIPTEQWKHGVKMQSGSLRVVPNMDMYKLSIMTVVKGTIRKDGLHVERRLYDYYKIDKVGQKITVAYDQRDISSIYIPNENWTGYKEAFLKGGSTKYKGWSLDEVEFDFEIINDNNALIEQKDAESCVEVTALIGSIIKESNKQEAEYVQPTTQAAKINGKRERKQLASNAYSLKSAIRIKQHNKLPVKCEINNSSKSIEEKREEKMAQRMKNAEKSRQK